jgi:hypothetical protein
VSCIGSPVSLACVWQQQCTAVNPFKLERSSRTFGGPDLEPGSRWQPWWGVQLYALLWRCSAACTTAYQCVSLCTSVVAARISGQCMTRSRKGIAPVQSPHCHTILQSSVHHPCGPSEDRTALAEHGSTARAASFQLLGAPSPRCLSPGAATAAGWRRALAALHRVCR